jgi:hypothetical protein
MSFFLNVVSFDVPFPANYGGVIDVYYKLVSLKAAGVRVILHCFSNGRKPASELDALCEKVYYYERSTGLLPNLSLSPYTVKSRQSKELENNLLSNDHPILFEVLHTCYLMKDPRFASRKKIYRHSNIEHDYYMELSRSEKSLTKKMYLKVEALKLKNFESILKYADLILAVNRKDTLYFQQKYPSARSIYLPSFHPNSTSTIKEGHSEYLLFHGNLSISENYEAAEWLCVNVFSRMNFKVVVAGLNPPPFLLNTLSRYPNIQVKVSPNEEEMIQLIRNAQVHVLYTSQPTGLKLKLLNVLFKGRFIVCNPNMLAGTDIEAGNSLFICHTPADFVSKISECYYKDFSGSFVKDREKLTALFDNERNVKKLISEVFGNA